MYMYNKYVMMYNVVSSDTCAVQSQQHAELEKKGKGKRKRKREAVNHLNDPQMNNSCKERRDLHMARVNRTFMRRAGPGVR